MTSDPEPDYGPLLIALFLLVVVLAVLLGRALT